MAADDDSVTDDQSSEEYVPISSGMLWQRIVEVSQAALASGSLLPIPTRQQTLTDGEAVFRVHVLENLKRKQVAAKTSRGNPFLPYDSEMFVGHVNPNHVALLNKFNVVDHHLLIVTRDFEPQEDRLNRSDFVALWHCLCEYESLAFYNSGEVAGASQRHKHLQLIPLTQGADVTLEPLYDLDSIEELVVSRSTRLPFEHRLVRFNASEMKDIEQAATLAHRSYEEIIDQLGWHAIPYNLLVTPSWMLFVPRRRESFDTISLNAMAFAGSLLVKDERQLATLRDAGPMRALVEVSGSA